MQLISIMRVIIFTAVNSFQRPSTEQVSLYEADNGALFEGIGDYGHLTQSTIHRV